MIMQTSKLATDFCMGSCLVCIYASRRQPRNSILTCFWIITLICVVCHSVILNIFQASPDQSIYFTVNMRAWHGITILEIFYNMKRTLKYFYALSLSISLQHVSPITYWSTIHKIINSVWFSLLIFNLNSTSEASTSSINLVHLISITTFMYLSF